MWHYLLFSLWKRIPKAVKAKKLVSDCTPYYYHFHFSVLSLTHFIYYSPIFAGIVMVLRGIKNRKSVQRKERYDALTYL